MADFTYWTSGNEKIDILIQEMQLKIDFYNDIVFEWIPFNQFNDVEKIGEKDLYLAIWKDGPLIYNSRCEYIRNQNKKVSLKWLHNAQSEFLNEVGIYEILTT